MITSIPWLQSALIFDILKHFSIYNVSFYPLIISYTLSIPFNNCSSDVVQWTGSWKWYTKTGDSGYIPTRLRVCLWPYWLSQQTRFWSENRLQDGLKRKAGSYGYNYSPGTRIVCLDPVTSAAMQCLCTPLTITWCHHRWPRKVKIFHVLPMASGRGSTLNF